ncbi:unnamed protein product [Leptidea sinapis]|uniref:Methyltransferase domain-containing protein n=1 Tax=Leptidea sinapis TaxID=189913 RepID=A0A5E4QS87_9NEOP|nr:unnamed protein product [Leptidea sinapis]
MDLKLLENSTSKSSTTLSYVGKSLIYTTGGLALGVSVVCLPFISPAFRKICLPYVPATTEQLINVSKALKGHTGKLIDIGSGDGRIVFSASRLGFKADGVELNRVLVYYSRIVALINNQYKNTRFYKCNLWSFDLKPYNNIVIFGVDQMMPDFEKKVIQEVDNGTVVVACRFPLPNMVPKEIIGQGVDTVWKYVVNR